MPPRGVSLSGVMEREELVEELLVLFPPDDPACLVRAALVSKRWCRLICGRRFQRRFREHHGGTPPLLGFVRQRHDDRTAAERRLFVPATPSFHPRGRDRDHAGHRRSFRAVHSCHGRVLLRAADPVTAVYPFSGVTPEDVFVWDPVTDKLRELPRWPLDGFFCPWNAAVLCAASAVAGAGCDHFECSNDDGPFVVVFVGNLVYDVDFDHVPQTFTRVYSSQDDSWSEPMAVHSSRFDDDEGNAVVVGNAVYFMCHSVTAADGPAILKYDLLTRQASPMRIPRVGVLKRIHGKDTVAVLMATEDGRLGLAFADLFTSTEKPKLYLFSREHSPGGDGDAGWAQSRVMDLDVLLLQRTEISRSTCVVM